MLKCLRCAYEWKPKVAHPKACPQCNSRKWQTPSKWKELRERIAVLEKNSDR